MGRKRDLSDFVKGQVETLHSEGYSQCHIACKLKISRCAVQNVLKSDGVDGRKNCGRKRKTNSRQDRIMKAAVVRSPHASSARIAHNMRADGIEVSGRTVRRRLSTEFNLVARRPAKKPLITKKQLQARLRFCKSQRDKPITWWDNVMFSDTFQQVRGTGSNYVRRPVSQRLNPKYTLKT